MPAITPASRADTQKTPCPHCGKPYRTLVKREYGIKIDGGIKQSVPLHSLWRCRGCGRTDIGRLFRSTARRTLRA